MRTIGPYEVVRELGRGGMGVVYEVRHPGIPRPLALKLILGPADEQALARFAREAQVMARIRHPGVVTVHQLTRVADGPILVTDLVQGRSLAQLVKDALPGTIAPRRAATLVRALADALEAVHAHGVLHRDLKPDNVIVRDDDTPVLLDFGLAREESAERLTQTGQLMGTPAYMSPEQAEGGSPTRVGPASDVYGLGAILFELLAGQPPFDGRQGVISILSKVLTQEPRWPSQDRADVPPELEAICRVAMAREPLSRYRTATALRADLDAFLGGRQVSATERFRPPAQRRALVLGALVALVAAATALAVAVALRPGRSEAVTSTASVATRGRPTRARTPIAGTPVAAERWADRVEGAAGRPFPQVLATLRHASSRLAPDAPIGDALPVYARFIDDGHVVTAGPAGTEVGVRGVVRFWDLEAPAASSRDVAAGGDRHMNVVALGPGRAAVVGYRDGVIAVDAARGLVTTWSERRPDEHFSPGIVALGEDVLVGRYTLPAGAAPGQQPTSCEVIRVGPARAPEVLVRTAFFTTDQDVRGDLLAVVTARRKMGADDPGEGELVVTRVGEAPLLELPLRTNARRVALSRDGKHVAVGLGGGFLDVYALATGEVQSLQSDALNSSARDPLLSVNSAHNALLNGLAFSLDGERLWSACGQSDQLEPWDGELRSWLLEGGAWGWVEPLTHPPGGTFEDRQRKRAENQLLASVVSLELSPDGRVLLLGTLAGEALLLAVPRDAR